MKKIFVCLVSIILFASNKSISQSKDTCDIWKNYIGSINKKFDTIKVNVRFLGTLENIYHHPYHVNDKNTKFYQMLEKRFNGLKIALEFELVDCDRGYYFPIVYKSKYDYTLFPRKNKKGKFEDWRKGQLLLITLVRYNRYFENSNDLITIVTDIEAINDTENIK
ncbi:MAG: hypothetical protein Q8K64_07550 [Sediminibacterium sp.]|nr:hypothetical protein [Sediminibacterium sp.]